MTLELIVDILQHLIQVPQGPTPGIADTEKELDPTVVALLRQVSDG